MTRRLDAIRSALPIAVFVIALAVRVALVLLHPRPLLSDEIDYDQLGWTLAETGRYEADGHPTAYRPIGYPAAVALVYTLFGRNPTAVKLLQALCDSATALLLVLLMRKRRPLGGIGLGLFWAFFPAAILFASQMFSESLFVFGLVAFTAVACAHIGSLHSPERMPLGAACGVGLILGALVLVKPVLVPFGVAISLVLVSRSRRAGLLMVACAVLPVALWIGRNARVFDRPALSTSVGTNLWIGNNPRATGGYSVPPDLIPDSGEEVRSDSAAMLAAWMYIREHPGRFLALGVKKVLLLMTSEGELAVGHFSQSAGDPSLRFRQKLREVPVLVHLAISFPSALVLMLGILGFAVRRHDCLGTIFSALLIVTLASAFVFFGGSRFRFPLMPFLALFASEFVADPGRSFRGAPRWRLVCASAACLAVAVVWVVEAYQVYG